jgi:Putative metal-binding motif
MASTTTRPLLLLVAAIGAGTAGCSNEFGTSRSQYSLVIDPPLTDVGILPLGEWTSLSLEMTAEGNDVEVAGIEVLNEEGDAFTRADQSLPVIMAGDTETLTLTYDPSEAGFHVAEIVVSVAGDDSALHRAIVRGGAQTAAVTTWPSVVDFGRVDAGESVSVSVTVRNSGQADLELRDVSSAIAGFTVQSALPVDLSQGEQTDLAFTLLSDDGASLDDVATLVFGTDAVTASVLLRANDCTTDAGPLYDLDDDGYSWCGMDCDDDDAGAHPGADEECDGVDQDCDGVVDEGTSCGDDDNDGYTEDQGDCYDDDPRVSPAASESANYIDDDCDGLVDEGTSLADDDGDGFSEYAGDCDDSDSAVHPNAVEVVGDGIDNDCTGGAA